MTREAENERTAGGVLGKAIGKAKEAAGSLAGNETLAREGRLQQAQGDADTEAAAADRTARLKQAEADTRREEVETEAERARLENEVAEELGKRRIEEDRRNAEATAEQEAQRRRAEAEQQKRSEETRAEQSVHQAEQAQVGASQEAIDLQRAARQAEERADRIDPEEAS